MVPNMYQLFTKKTYPKGFGNHSITTSVRLIKIVYLLYITNSGSYYQMVEEDKDHKEGIASEGDTRSEISNKETDPMAQEVKIGGYRTQEGVVEDVQKDDEAKVEIESKAIEEEKEKKEKGEEEAIRITKEELEALKKRALERDDFLDKLQRTRADYSNYQKRMNNEIEKIRRFAIQDLTVALTSILDNFNRAVNSSKELKDFTRLLEGIQIVENQLYKILESYGMKSIETVGKPFDPLLHEAVMEVEDHSQPHHTIIEELQRGFLLHDRVIKPAKVKVSKMTKEKEMEKETKLTEGKEIEKEHLEIENDNKNPDNNTENAIGCNI